MKKYKKRFGDRYDGRLLKKIDPFYKIVPYIMKTRVDSQVHFDNKVYLDKTTKFMRELRSKDIKVSFLHIVIAAMVRTVSQKPRINRFVSGRKIYARNEIAISLAVKKDMNENTPETTVKVVFEPTDTIYDVVEKLNKSFEENTVVDNDNETDKLAKAIMLVPGFLVKFFVGLMNFLDHRGLMPKLFNKLSPFHSSIFITDLGSLGIQPVYHHIYNFGTTSQFMAFGIKNIERKLDKDGNVTMRKYVDLKIVVDERICDGHYYATAFKLFKKLVENPYVLTTPPEEFYEDDEV